MYNVIELGAEEQRLTGATHVVQVDYAKLAATADTTVTLTVASGVARDMVTGAFFDLVTPFDGGATRALLIDFGHDLAAGTDDADLFIDREQIHADGTEILASLGTGSGFAAQEAFDLELVFTATGANLTALTAGRVDVYFNWVRPSKQLRGIND